MATFLDVRNEAFDCFHAEDFTFFVLVGAEWDRWLETLDAVAADLHVFLTERAGEPVPLDLHAQVTQEDGLLFLDTYAARMTPRG